MDATTLESLHSDWRYVWHPFTDASLWEQWGKEGEAAPHLVSGEGVYLWDSEGKRYFDGNSSIWTNIHGHSHPVLVAALQRQAGILAHSSYLGLGHPWGSELARRLCQASGLERCFFSDNGSTAVEVALRMELQFRMQRGQQKRRRFVSFDGSYHGDTLGAASLGAVGRFFESIAELGPEVTIVRSVEELLQLEGDDVAGVIIEPLIQGVNEMRPWPQGTLSALKDWCVASGAHLILDEVMTGFGRTGSLFACQQEGVVPDYLCLAKGITGGLMPLAATLTKNEIYESFRGSGNTFYYGHSYTANPLGCAVALANLDLCEVEDFLPQVRKKGELMASFSDSWQALEVVKEVRRCGMVMGIELKSFSTGRGIGESGKTLCRYLRNNGLLTRPILDTVVWMPPLVSSEEELGEMAKIFDDSLSRL